MRPFLVLSVVLLLAFAGCLGPKCPDVYDPVCGSDNVTYANTCLATQANVQVKSPGACAADVCTDSDGGKDLFTKGSATDAQGSMADVCKDALQVTEAYCTGTKASSETIPCPSGYACSDGACIKSPCQDSDGGKIKETKGTVTSQGASLIDECSTALKVKEYFCSNDVASSEEISCGAGMECSNGACVEALCIDSDNGKATTASGNVRKGADTYADVCSGTGSVKEYFCIGKTVDSEIIPCQSGYICSDGKCARLVCTDSDSGKDIFTKGTAAYGNTTGTDNCYSTTQVLEYYCSSDSAVAVEKIACGTGKECYDGKCRTVQCVETQTDIDEEGLRYQIAAFDDADELLLRTTESVELNGGFFMKLNSVSGNDTGLRVYEDYETLKDSDTLCSLTIADGDSEDDLCGESTGVVEVISVDDSEDTAEFSIDKYYAVEYYNLEGSKSDWTDNPLCDDDEVVYDFFRAEFYPYLETSASGLDLEGKRFMLFETLVTINEVTSDSISFELDGDDITLEDGDTFDYLGEEYEAALTFNDEGLIRFQAEPS
ncbi:MAG: Kazal-type serine protease inhibitor family protein [Candidatus Micrarchaeota archaeon]